MRKTLFLNPETVHKTWKPFFSNTIVNELIEIEKKIDKNYTPLNNKVLRFSSVDLTKVKIVIVGQDPYPQAGIATGRAFEVNGLKSWGIAFKQSSLRNILKLLYKTYKGELIKFSELRNKINEFNVLPPNELFNNWEKQGVLLLNIYLTCEVNAPRSHRKQWVSFSKKLFSYINNVNKNANWFLWGNESQQFIKNIDMKNVFISDHPMICSVRKKGSFINSDCFEKTKHLFNWLGI